MRILLWVLAVTTFTRIIAQDKITLIKRSVLEIDNSVDLDTTWVDAWKLFGDREHWPCQGMEIFVFERDDTLLKVNVSSGLSSCHLIQCFYVQGGELIAMKIEGHEFEYDDTTGSFNYDRSERTLDGIFFYGQEPIDAIVNGQTRCTGQLRKDDAEKYRAQWLELANKLSLK